MSRVAGFRFAGVHCGIKKGGAPDLAVIVAEGPVACAGVYTRNRVVAAPVVQSRARLGRSARAQVVVVNSGNANACTGEEGARDAERMAALGAEAVGGHPDHVQVASTGCIGAPLPMKALEAGIAQAIAGATADGLPAFARAIMTTDTRPKLRATAVTIEGRSFTVAGVAKGAGMIHPDMATMLGFVCTDAPVDAPTLDGMWRRICDRSFNAITIDGDTSTNDTALLLASGAAGGGPLGPIALRALEVENYNNAHELALDIVRDAEGGNKLVHLTVDGAPDAAAARVVAEAIATSPLVKTALHGEDPNWGRIIAAAGRSGVAVEPSKMSLSIGGVPIFEAGRWLGTEAEAKAHAVMCTAEYPIHLGLGLGDGAITLFTCDFGADYVRINADYRS